MTARVNKAELFETLPSPWPEDLRPHIRAALAAQPDHKLVVLDDDPTGTQTVYDVPVLTSWEEETLRAEFNDPRPCFYVLTNSRSLSPEEARLLTHTLARQLQAAAGKRPFTVVSRSDSTLRGHFPVETDALAAVLGPFDATLLIPYFEDGGRYTIDDVHYVADGDMLALAAETQFARDAAFGYRNSNLRAYIEEKSGGRVKAGEVFSIGLSELRRGGPEAITARLLALPRDSFSVVNAAAPRDLEVFVAGLLAAEAQGRRYCFRTAAQFPAARLGLEQRPLLTAQVLELTGRSTALPNAGGLLVVGSHVATTTGQLAPLLNDERLLRIELRVEELLSARRQQVLDAVSASLAKALATGRDAVVFTSRELWHTDTASESLLAGRRISEALVELVCRLEVRPRYLIAKGGITTSDIATLALGVKRAVVLGQLIPGVPVWRLGPETKFPGLTYVVFPGNVGGPTALVDAMARLNEKGHP